MSAHAVAVVSGGCTGGLRGLRVPGEHLGVRELHRVCGTMLRTIRLSFVSMSVSCC